MKTRQYVTESIVVVLFSSILLDSTAASSSDVLFEAPIELYDVGDFDSCLFYNLSDGSSTSIT